VTCQEELDALERLAWRLIWVAYFFGVGAGVLCGWFIWGLS
jgi:hypothetical protein